jgi:L-2-hydroxyglutarate oxidase LhgO
MFTAAVIGAGVVGCHTALHLAGRGYQVYLLEKNGRIGQETSTRNSGVLHAGIYYRQDSLKANLCVEGNALSREFFWQWEVPFMPTGKYIIARNPGEEGELEALYGNALRNSVPDMERVTTKRIRDEFPFLSCTAAFFSGSTGIVDAGEYMRTLYGLLDRYEVQLLRDCRVLHISAGPAIETDRGPLEADIVVNAAGLHADELARSAGVTGYEIVPLKGDYLVTRSLRVAVPVYPVPTHGHNTLGIHLTPTFSGETLIGPSEVPSSGKDNYAIETPRSVFEDSLRGMIDTATLGKLALDEGYSGNRPRAWLEGKRCEDFVIIEHPSDVFHLIGIESPGLTAAPAIAAHVYGMI